MPYEPDTETGNGLFYSMTGKKLALLLFIIIIGGFFGVQAMFGFPIKDLVRADVTCRKISTKKLIL